MATWLVALPCFSLSLFLAFCCRVVVAFGLCNESLSSPERAMASAPRHQQLDIYILPEGPNPIELTSFPLIYAFRFPSYILPIYIRLYKMKFLFRIKEANRFARGLRLSKMDEMGIYIYTVDVKETVSRRVSRCPSATCILNEGDMKYWRENLPPPFCWTRYGKRQTLPNPTEYPMALNINCNLLSHFWRSGGNSGTCSTASFTTLLLLFWWLLDVVSSAATVAETPGIGGGRKLWPLLAAAAGAVINEGSLPLRNIISWPQSSSSPERARLRGGVRLFAAPVDMAQSIVRWEHQQQLKLGKQSLTLCVRCWRSLSLTRPEWNAHNYWRMEQGPKLATDWKNPGITIVSDAQDERRDREMREDAYAQLLTFSDCVRACVLGVLRWVIYRLRLTPPQSYIYIYILY